MLTERDRKILSHIEEFNGITINQCAKCYFRNIKYAYDVARKRLNRMVEVDMLKVTRNTSTSENVYYIDKKLNYTEIMVMNFYSELLGSGTKIHEFKKNATFLDGEFKCDAYFSFVLNNKLYPFCIEVCLNYNKLNLSKYAVLYESNFFQSQIGMFPKLIVIEGVERKTPISLPNINVIEMNVELSNFTEIFAV